MSSTQTKLKTWQNFVNGEWVSAGSGKTTPNINPANADEILGYSQQSELDDLEKAVTAAREAYPGWRKTPSPARGKFLSKAAALLEKRKEELAKALTLEEGKAFQESLGEVQKSINILEFFAALGRRLNGESIPSELPKNFIYTKREPLGVVALITPWNFPVAIPAWKAGAALIAGNTAVLKPSSLTPWTASLLMEIFQEANLPKGVLNLITGPGSVLGEAIVKHPHVRAISFTGSTETGRKLQALAGAHGKPIQLEMGGKNAVIVLKDADLDLAASGVVFGAFGSAGQRCTATSRCLVEESVLPAFTDKLLEKIRPFIEKMHEGTVGPLVDENQLKKVLHYIDLGKKEGASLLVGGKRMTEGALGKGYFVSPTIFTNVAPSMTIAQEEIFGPVLTITAVKDMDEAIRISNDVEYGLSGSIFTQNINQALDYVDDIEIGVVHVNSPTIGGEAQAPFGGMKGSGVGGREMGHQSLDFFTEWKTVYIDYTDSNRKGNLY